MKFLTKENFILVLLAIIILQGFFLNSKIEDAAYWAESAEFEAREAKEIAQEASYWAEEARGFALDASNTSFANNCNYCPQ